MCTNYIPIPRDFVREKLDLQRRPSSTVTNSGLVNLGPRLIRDYEWRLAIFGMVPFFSKDGKDFRGTHNARSETADQKPTYAGPWRRRQLALVPMQAFYGPNYESGKPVRWRIERRDGDPFTVAALWDTWKPRDGETGRRSRPLPRR